MTQPLVELGFPDSDRRPDQLLAHALDLVREGGLGALTMKKVADRVGFTETAAYRYFPTKRDLVAGLVARLAEVFLGRVRKIAAREDLDPRERLERIVRTHLDIVRATDGIPVLLLAEGAAAGDADLLERMRGTVDTYLGLLESLLPDPAPGTDALPRHDAALLLFALAAVLAIRLRIGAGNEDGVPDRLLPFVLRALTDRPGGAP